VIHPQLRLGIPCYDLVPIADLGLDRHKATFGHCRLCWLDGRCVQDLRTYSPRPADPRLLAIPASWGRVAAPNLNWGEISEICLPLPVCVSLFFAIVGCV